MKAESKTKIREAIGHASMCWNPAPTGVFDEQEANKVADNLIKVLDQSEDSEAVEFAEWIQRNSWLEGKESGVWYKWHGMECDEGNPKTTKELYQIFKSQR